MLQQDVVTVIISKLSNEKSVYSIILLIIDVFSKILLECLILSLRLFIRLRVKSDTVSQIYLEIIAESRSEFSSEKRFSIRNYEHRFFVLAKNFLFLHISQIFRLLIFSEENIFSKFDVTIDHLFIISYTVVTSAEDRLMRAIYLSYVRGKSLKK